MIQDGTLFYHGSYVAIESIDLSKGAAGKDFGKGFYLTTNENQAIGFIPTALAKAKARKSVQDDQNYGYVTTFRYHQPGNVINYYEFKDADRQWLWFIAQNRRSKLASVLDSKIDDALKSADIIAGKIANDTTNPVITTYLNGLFGDVDSEMAVSDTIKRLLPDRLEKQYCFLTEEAVACLEVVEVKRYEI